MIQELINRADQRGYLTLDDVLEVLDEDGDDITSIETVLYELDELGIEIRQESEAAGGVGLSDDQDIEFEPEEIPQDPGIGDINAVSADDPVGLYFRQMAQEPLLTAQEEIELAKRIEIGKESRECLLRVDAYEVYGETGVLRLQRMIMDGQSAREHLGRANTRLVVSIAKRYMGQGLPFPDLIQEGLVSRNFTHQKISPTSPGGVPTVARIVAPLEVTRAEAAADIRPTAAVAVSVPSAAAVTAAASGVAASAAAPVAKCSTPCAPSVAKKRRCPSSPAVLAPSTVVTVSPPTAPVVAAVVVAVTVAEAAATAARVATDVLSR